MKNEELSKRIKALRQRKGMSQDELADMSGLSLRTIQRIENGETEPLGDSLKRLASAFDVAPDEITDWQIKEDPGYLMLLNLSALSFIIFPLLGIIVPMAMWVMKKDKVKNVDYVGKAILNFQITWNVAVFLILLIVLMQIFFKEGVWISVWTLMLIPVGLYFYNALLIIINAVRSANDKKVNYIPAIKILK
jgi:transcriptional regulator with XRE-family HTH domain